MSLRMAQLMGKRFLRKTISCKKVVSEISNYVDGNMTPELRSEIEQHVRICDRCSAILDSTRKLIYIAGEEQVFVVPFASNQNWEQLLNEARGQAPQP